MKTIAVCLALASSAAAVRLQLDSDSPPALAKYKQDCKISRQRKHKKMLAALQEGKNVPGAGIDEFEPYVNVYKDGFYQVACIKDSLLEFGDKFGDGKFNYKMGPVSNVSIVHYTEVVAKEDRKPMTHALCFEFCRSVPNMGFFGIHNGRDCYCEPYYKASASDSTECDAVCEGETTQMCGGKVKSSIFGMHSCADTQEDLTELEAKATKIQTGLFDVADNVEILGKDMQSAAETLQAAAGQAGDGDVSDLLQAAKVFAGELEHASEKGKKLDTKIVELNQEVTSTVAGKLDFTVFENADKADGLEKDMDKLLDEAVPETKELTALQALAEPPANATKDAEKQYYPVMYFVDKEFVDVPSTCSGAGVEEAKPMVSPSENDCAWACDKNIHECVAYMFFPQGGLCFLFSKLKEVTYWTGCGGEQKGPAQQGGTRFLQKKKQGGNFATCKAKLSKFEGTNITPQKDGDCKGCLKEAKKANRCYEM